MKYFKLEKNLVINYVIHLSLQIQSVYNGRESVSFMDPMIWKLIPPAFKQVKSLSGFKKAIKKRKPSNCP